MMAAGAATHLAAPPPTPEWTITGALLFWKDGVATHAVQSPFVWDGAGWVASLQVTRTSVRTVRVIEAQLVLSPETLDRWIDRSLLPPFETTRQVQAHLLRYGWTLDDLGAIPLT
ncbi:MAG: hypothetical protein AB7O67_08705 [Vicinamibacterales bacterium]